MRRYFLTSLALLFVLIPIQAQELKVKEISDQVFVISGAGGNITVISTGEGLVVTDTFTTLVSARKAKDIITTKSQEKIRYVINTHYHSDHTFGNQVFADAVIVGHRNCRERMLDLYAERAKEYAGAGQLVSDLGKKLEKAQASSEDTASIEEELKRARRIKENYTGFVLTPPEIALEDGATLQVGDSPVKLLYFGSGHTDTDLVVFVPEHKLLIMGDLLFHEMLPYIDINAGADIRGWISTLDNLMQLGDKVQHVVPGHGEVGDLNILKKQRDYLNNLLEVVEKVRAEGKTLDQAKQEVKLEEYSSWPLYDRFLPVNIEAAWTQLEREDKK